MLHFPVATARPAHSGVRFGTPKFKLKSSSKAGQRPRHATPRGRSVNDAGRDGCLHGGAPITLAGWRMDEGEGGSADGLPEKDTRSRRQHRTAVASCQAHRGRFQDPHSVDKNAYYLRDVFTAKILKLNRLKPLVMVLLSNSCSTIYRGSLLLVKMRLLR